MEAKRTQKVWTDRAERKSVQRSVELEWIGDWGIYDGDEKPLKHFLAKDG